jgi:hypothetical protein
MEIRIPKPHKNQQFILDHASRFNLLKCGRRFGKTTLIKKLCKPALQYGQFIGIFTPTYKDVAEVWKDLNFTFYPAIRKKNEQLKQIETITGGVIDFWSMEDPNSGRGRKYHGAIVDEAAKAKKFKEAWQETIRPTLTDFKGWAYFMSTPKGKNNYYYTLEQNMKDQPDWAFFKFTTYDNPYIDPAEIDSARNQLDAITFDQEYMAEDVDLNDRPFLYAFDRAVHVVKEKYTPNTHLPIIVSFDFNKDPMTCSLGQMVNVRELKVFDALKIENGSTPELCDKIIAKYPQFLFKMEVTGDASGKNRSPLLVGNVNHYTIIKQKLQLKDIHLKVQSKNRELSASRILCNSILQNAEVTIWEGLHEFINDIALASVDSDGELIKTNEEGRHFFDNFRYMLEACYPSFIEKPWIYQKKI